ncbi:hydrogenase maturation factor [Rhodoblastus acidophilus]|uniref:toll/interleukin-1 receptor domain-containing protein n=1 Tax=Rhodoblastus acidophilus TaxID=1074 RepID=UPI0022253894|nr:toll/interleukin-1 receptor domain-containing protein [Rhodoblastus acidophilus]MCW2286831.1 hydrogenase maturation factor [Rhodoblastus acidophilus]MCW2335674.1 hydrogenase maturation factor [Rhodoblastus acidophilus]
MSIYELAILGSATEDERQRLTMALRGLTEDFGLVLGDDVLVHDGATVSARDKRAAFAAAYFGGVDCTDLNPALSLVRASAPVIPTVAADGDFGSQIPEFLQAANGLKRRVDDPDMTELAAAMLECVGLLRRQRRVFVSYRRVESRSAALQLHDLLAARGFDVFLDTHDIRPGDPFQDVLWHRLVGSDVMVMLDTPGYFDSRWTRQEIGRARAKDIQVLRVIWPKHTPSKLTDMAETVYLDAAELDGPDGPLASAVADSIVLQVERLRSRSIAARYLSITGKLRADVEKIGAAVEAVGAHRAIAVRLLDDRKIWAYPIVGIPTAEILNDVAEKARRADQREVPVLVYDHVGIRDAWSAHLRWLDEQIRAVRAIKVSEAGWTLAAWEG